jgi:hypothetical protein
MPVSEPWNWREPVTNNVTDDTNNNNVLREVATKAIAMPALLSVAAIVYMQMFRQQYNKRNK